jgi:hypothetical protein
LRACRRLTNVTCHALLKICLPVSCPQAPGHPLVCSSSPLLVTDGNCRPSEHDFPRRLNAISHASHTHMPCAHSSTKSISSAPFPFDSFMCAFEDARHPDCNSMLPDCLTDVQGMSHPLLRLLQLPMNRCVDYAIVSRRLRQGCAPRMAAVCDISVEYGVQMLFIKLSATMSSCSNRSCN